MYFPLIDILQKSLRELLRWFFVKCLFSTREMQNEVTRYFDTGQTRFRFFEWLNTARMKRLYPQRWKIILTDFVGAYLKLSLLGVVIGLFCFLRLTAG